MPLAPAVLYQGYNDLGDFWDILKSGMDPALVAPNAHARYRGLTMTAAVPGPDQALIGDDEEIIGSDGFFLDASARNKIRQRGLDPDRGVVMSGLDMPLGLEKQLRRGMEALGLKAVVVQNSTAKQHDPHRIGVFVDVGQLGFSETMNALHQKLPDTAQRLVSRTAQARDFMRWLETKRQECALPPGIRCTEENLLECTRKAVFSTVLDDIIQGAEQELASRSMVSMRRFRQYVDLAYGSAHGFLKLIEVGYISNDLSDPRRSPLMASCQLADVDGLKGEVMAEFARATGRSLDGRETQRLAAL